MSGVSQALAARVRCLEDIEAIRQLKARYARCCDPTHDIDGMVDLFADDAVFDIGPEYGVHTGRTDIRRFLEGADGIIPWAIHYIGSPIVEIDPGGCTAQGSWYLWQLASVPARSGEGHEAVWIAGVYDDRLVKEDTRWRFARVALRMQIMSPYTDGWVKTPWIGK